MTREQLAAVWLEWRNDYLSLDLFAEHKGLYPAEAAALLMLAEQCQQRPHPEA